MIILQNYHTFFHAFVSTVHVCSSLSFSFYWTVCWSVWPASSVQNLLWINLKLWLWWKLLLLFWFWDWCYWSDLVTTLFDIRYPCSNNWQRLALRPEQDLKMIKIIDIIRISSLLKRKTGGLGRWLLYLIISEYHRKQEDLDDYDYSFQKEKRRTCIMILIQWIKREDAKTICW